GRVRLVDDEGDGLATSPEQPDEVVLHRQETGRSVEHAEDAVRLTDGTERLRAHARRERRGVARGVREAAGVDAEELAPAVLGGGDHAIADRKSTRLNSSH